MAIRPSSFPERSRTPFHKTERLIVRDLREEMRINKKEDHPRGSKKQYMSEMENHSST